jgi:hypothetical protein
MIMTRTGKRTIIKDLPAEQAANKPARPAGEAPQIRSGLRAGMPSPWTTINYVRVD